MTGTTGRRAAIPADPALQDFGPARFDAVGALERRDGVVWIKIHRVTAIKTSYKWLFLWDYTFYKWGDLLVLITDKWP